MHTCAYTHTSIHYFLATVQRQTLKKTAATLMASAVCFFVYSPMKIPLEVFFFRFWNFITFLENDTLIGNAGGVEERLEKHILFFKITLII